MNRRVLDASVVLAWLLGEPGGHIMGDGEDDLLSAVNYAEVVARLIDLGSPREVAVRRASNAPCDIVAFDLDLAVSTAALRPLTRHRGLSLGDRACLALALREGAPALTADRAWEGLDVGVEVVLIR